MNPIDGNFYDEPVPGDHEIDIDEILDNEDDDDDKQVEDWNFPPR